MARSIRDYQWRFMAAVAAHGLLWFTPWEKNRRPQLDDEWRDGLITGLDIVHWWHQHPDWFLIGLWDDTRSARPVSLTDAGRQALSQRDPYDREPVESGMVEPGWSAIPEPRS